MSGIVRRVPRGVSLYLHIPFCARKCPYCDFNTYAGLESRYADTVAALCAEIERRGTEAEGRTVETVFIGGGTPTVLSEDDLSRLLGTIRAAFTLAPHAEITCEANPGSADRSKFAALRSLGVNRISIGVQSFQPEELRFLGRVHDVDDAGRAYDAARDAGFDNVSLDLMFGLPDQKLTAWRSTLETAIALAPDHISLYSLIVEPGTPLATWVASGTVGAPDDDEAAAHYEIAIERMAAAGYRHYEVSNWARGSEPGGGLESAHNLVYWRNGDWIGIGPGAHGHIRSATPAGDDYAERRYGNLRPVDAYVGRVRDALRLADVDESIDPATARGESMMLGLRLVTEGVDRARFRSRHGMDPTECFGAELDELSGWGLLEVEPERIRLTERGLFVGDQVFLRFIASGR